MIILVSFYKICRSQIYVLALFGFLLSCKQSFVPSKNSFVCKKGPLQASCETLIKLYPDSLPKNQYVKDSWFRSEDICNWYGVGCDENHQVVELALNNLNLTKLPEDTFQHFPYLRALFLEDNQLTSLPPGIFQGLLSLRFLELQQNQLSFLPESIFQGLPKLEWIDLSDNKLTSLPTNLFQNLPALKILRLRNNLFSSQTKLPVSLCKQVQLKIEPSFLCQ